MDGNNDNELKLSEHGAKLIEELADMPKRESEKLTELAIMLANNLRTIMDYIEKPESKVSNNVIHFAGSLFLPIKNLKKELVSDELDIETYLLRLNDIIDNLLEIAANNLPVMKHKGVYKHMREITNVIIRDLEAGAVLNTMFALVDDLSEDDSST